MECALFEGYSGKVKGATIIGGDAKGTDSGDCVEFLLLGISIPRFKQTTFSVTYPFSMDRITNVNP
jgi:hypothetical protein